MTRIESELHDLYECLMRNDDMADHDTYNTIVGIANDVAEVEAENAKLRELVALMYRNMQGVLDCSTDTVFANDFMTLRDHMDECMEVMADLGMPPRDYESRRRDLGLEGDE